VNKDGSVDIKPRHRHTVHTPAGDVVFAAVKMEDGAKAGVAVFAESKEAFQYVGLNFKHGKKDFDPARLDMRLRMNKDDGWFRMGLVDARPDSKSFRTFKIHINGYNIPAPAPQTPPPAVGAAPAPVCDTFDHIEILLDKTLNEKGEIVQGTMRDLQHAIVGVKKDGTKVGLGIGYNKASGGQYKAALEANSYVDFYNGNGFTRVSNTVDGAGNVAFNEAQLDKLAGNCDASAKGRLSKNIAIVYTTQNAEIRRLNLELRKGHTAPAPVKHRVQRSSSTSSGGAVHIAEKPAIGGASSFVAPKGTAPICKSGAARIEQLEKQLVALQEQKACTAPAATPAAPATPAPAAPAKWATPAAQAPVGAQRFKPATAPYKLQAPKTNTPGLPLGMIGLGALAGAAAAATVAGGRKLAVKNNTSKRQPSIRIATLGGAIVGAGFTMAVAMAPVSIPLALLGVAGVAVGLFPTIGGIVGKRPRNRFAPAAPAAS